MPPEDRRLGEAPDCAVRHLPVSVLMPGRGRSRPRTAGAPAARRNVDPAVSAPSVGAVGDPVQCGVDLVDRERQAGDAAHGHGIRHRGGRLGQGKLVFSYAFGALLLEQDPERLPRRCLCRRSRRLRGDDRGHGCSSPRRRKRADPMGDARVSFVTRKGSAAARRRPVVAAARRIGAVPPAPGSIHRQRRKLRFGEPRTAGLSPDRGNARNRSDGRADCLEPTLAHPRHLLRGRASEAVTRPSRPAGAGNRSATGEFQGRTLPMPGNRGRDP